ncbi:hypothetical protein L202_07142 [Cryptococcus amylolentus CBS 6039]|uniref:Major facilitator superfamily (MFS) profile domain-containing protein n=1 Tax=Cryptococcus amylolentus CBS 6039 TaxID=1295533 RepID=A0A1E3HGF1_9TREE|nr:hypothetical protein L202_07142 [Cryptococcus amylolentus CBS 6039]ODN74836.1 hypothetical protein L202_07142 [Cryptococcus amylolentus CBS 6039]
MPSNERDSYVLDDYSKSPTSSSRSSFKSNYSLRSGENSAIDLPTLAYDDDEHTTQYDPSQSSRNGARRRSTIVGAFSRRPAFEAITPIHDSKFDPEAQEPIDTEHPLGLPAEQAALPPVDGGRKAWLFLAASAMLEMLVWGLPFAIGVLLSYWRTELFPDEGEDATLTLAATLQTGLLYMMAALVGPVVASLPRWQKTLQVIGIVAAALSMIASAFVSKPWHLLVTVGLIYPFAGGKLMDVVAAYFPCGALLFEWFYAKRGLATGIMYAGTGGCIMPFVMSALLDKLGYKTAMIILGSVFGGLSLICLIFIVPRVPPAHKFEHGTKRRHSIDWSFLKSKLLIVSVTIIFLTSLGNFIPSLWIPTYATDLNLSDPNGAALLSILNGASVPGNALLGFMSDRLPLRAVILISCLGSGFAVAFLWGFGTSKGMLVAFCVIFGLLGPSFVSLWTKINATIAKDNTFAFAIILSLFTFIRGIGNFSSGPISEALLKHSPFEGAIGGYGFENYGSILLYSSIMILSGGAAGAFFVERKLT